LLSFGTANPVFLLTTMAQPPPFNSATPWYAQPLPPQYDYGPGGFAALAAYASQQPGTNASPYRVAPIVACYSTPAQRLAAINGALPEDRPQYQAGRAVGSATRFYPTQAGGVGMVTSPYANAAMSSATAANEWHTVGLLRHGDTMWIHNPAYASQPTTATGAPEAQRLPMVPGMSNVTRLLDSTGFGTVNNLYIQGPGIPVQDSMQCMGRSAQWVDNVTRAPTASYPFPQGYFQAGQAPPGYYPLQRW
jgi:hypothetical protein